MKRYLLIALAYACAISGGWTHGTSYKLQRIAVLSPNGDSIYANPQHYDVAGNTIQWGTQGFATWLISGLGWNYTSPKSYAVGGTDLITETGYVTASCTGCGNWGDTAQFNTPMNALSPLPDLILQQGGINTCALGNLLGIETAQTNIMNAQSAVSATAAIVDLALFPYGASPCSSIRAPFNVWKAGTSDPSYPLTTSINSDTILQDPAVPGALNPIYGKEAGCDNITIFCLHLNAKGGQVEAAYLAPLIISQAKLVPWVQPVALNASNDPTNGFSTVGANSTQSQRMRCLNSCTASCTAAGGNVAGSRPADWPVTAGSSGFVTASVVTLHSQICQMVLNISSAGALTFAQSQINVTSPTIPNGFFVGGHTYRFTMTITNNSGNVANIQVSTDYVENGVTTHMRWGTGTDDDFSIIAGGTYHVFTPEWTPATCSSSCTMTTRITINYRGGSTPAGDIELYEPAVREFLYHAQWP